MRLLPMRYRPKIVALMSLEPGRKLAHYEVLELIGRGGMGEVYRAHDAKLKRDVALKVLPRPSPTTPRGWRASKEKRSFSRH